MSGKIIFMLVLVLVVGGSYIRCESDLPDGNSSAVRQDLPSLLKKIEGLTEADPQAAIRNCYIALESPENSEDKNLRASLARYLGDSYFYLRDYENSLNWYQQSAELAGEIEGEQSKSYQLRLADVAYVLEILHRYNEAISNYKKSLEIANEQSNWEEIITNLNNIGNSYYKLGEFEKAMDYLQQTLKSEIEHGKEENLSTVLNSIGTVYQAWGDYKKAEMYYNRALEIDRKFFDENKMAIRLNNLGYLYQEKEDYEKALEYLLEALELQEMTSEERRLMIRYSNISSIYIALQSYTKAIEYLGRVEKYLQDKADLEIEASYYENYGNLFFQQEQYGKSLPWHLKRLELAEKHDLTMLLLSAYSDIYNIYEKIGDYESAFIYQSNYMAMQDSLFTEKKHRQIAELEVKYETEKKENEIELLKKDAELIDMQLSANRRVRNLLILVLLLFILLVLAIFITYRHRNEVKRVLQEQKALKQSRLAILGEVAAGIMHEINQPLQSMSFTLENLKSALEERYADLEYLEKKTCYLLEDVSRMQKITDHIRTFSHSHAAEKKALFCLNDGIRNALNMTKQRYLRQGIRLDLQLEDKLPPLIGNLYSFEQVILILLSNARDAVTEKSLTADGDFQKKIYIHTQLREKRIVVQIGDNGPGIPEENLQKIFKPFFTTKEMGKGTGLGLAIARGIIREMAGEISVNSVAGKGTIINLFFNLTGAE